MIALAAGAGVFLISVGVRPRRPLVSAYLGADEGVQPRPKRWGSLDMRPPAIGAVIGGIAGSSVIAGAIIGGLAGAAIGRLVRRTQKKHRERRLGLELPAVADLLGLFLMSGDTVVAALRHFADESRGVASEEIRRALSDVTDGVDLPTALERAASESSHHDAGRLYRLLAQAHLTGSRLNETLRIYSSDRRSAISRDLAQEGGRRALTGYGPILGLMIPTTLVFLIYPTVAGLDALAVRP